MLETRTGAAPWYRNRLVWVAVILLLVSVGAVVLVRTLGSGSGQPTDLRGQLTARMLTVLEETDPAQHQGHAGHNADTPVEAPVICGARVYGFEPTTAASLTDVDRVYGFHLCGIAEPNRPWDWAVKLVGPVILELDTTPPTVLVAESTETVTFRERVIQMFPQQYHEAAFSEALTEEGMVDLRRRYDAAAGL